MASHTDRSELISMFIEAVLYGLYVASFVCTIYVLIYKRSSRHVHFGMFFVTVLMFALATTHLLINLLHIIDAFNLSQTYTGGTRGLFDDFSSFKNLFRTGVILTEIIVGDTVLIYRCYVAWGCLRVIFIPLIVLLGTAVTSGGVVYSFSNAPRGSDLFSIEMLQIFIISTQVLVFMNNVLCTSLLAWRLWLMSRAVVSREQRQGLRSVARIIAESGVITALAWVIYITLNAVRQPSALIVLNALAPITAGAFCLIVTRVALNKDIQKPPREAIHHRGVPSDEGVGAGSVPCTCSSPCTSISPTTPTTPRRTRIPRTPTCTCPRSVLPVLDGTGRPYCPVEISVSSRASVHVDMVEIDADDVYKDNEYKEKMVLAGLVGL